MTARAEVLFPSRQYLPADVFEGGADDLVICQEWPSLEGEIFSRIMLPMAEAEALAKAILDVARRRSR